MFNCNSFQKAKWVVVFFALFIGGLGMHDSSLAADNPALKVGFVCVGSVSDWGWNYAHNQGRLYLETKMPQQVKTTLAERIPESAEAERVLERLIAMGNKLIFTTSYGYLEPALRVAAKHPDVTFMQVNRFKTAKNLGTYFSHQYQPMYIAGTIAGKMTKSNKLGFVAAHPVPPLLQAVNAFTLGARSVNPKVTTTVVWVNSWSDSATEVEAMKSLAEIGVDVVAHIQDNQNTILKMAETLGIYSIGCYTDAHQLAPKGWLTGACLEWGPFYEKIAHSVIDGTWKSGITAQGMEGGYIKLASFGQAVPKEIRQQALSLENDIKTGRFIIFKGPLIDRQGKERLYAGEKADVNWLSNMDFFVAGVNGALPKG